MEDKPNTPTDKANAEPTKQFFIDTLIRDVDLKASLVDLIDNSVDGARRIRTTGDYEGLTINITLSPEKFEIQDNCGGIPIEIAENYAFRFGRPEGYDTKIGHSIGQFGVGMKRTLFKIARKFEIVSIAEESRFKLIVDINEWESSPEWNFPLTEVVRKTAQDPSKLGTTITVNTLKEEVSEEFNLENVVNELREDIRLSHQHAISKGLTINFNGTALEPEEITFIESEDIRPGVVTSDLKVDDDGIVNMRAVVGIGDRNSSESGWYIYCNNRLLLRADQSKKTGWGDALPKYHQQYDRFRGCLYLDSNNASLLPWNTTKTGFSEDSAVYKKARVTMDSQAQRVLQFLNRVRDEEVQLSNGHIDEAKLQNAVDAAEHKSVSTYLIAEVDSFSETFTWPTKDVQKITGPKKKNISYKVEEERLETAKQMLGVVTAREVGESTFNYFFDLECE